MVSLGDRYAGESRCNDSKQHQFMPSAVPAREYRNKTDSTWIPLVAHLLKRYVPSRVVVQLR